MWLFKATAYSVFECCLSLEYVLNIPASVTGSIMRRILFGKRYAVDASFLSAKWLLMLKISW